MIVYNDKCAPHFTRVLFLFLFRRAVVEDSEAAPEFAEGVRDPFSKLSNEVMLHLMGYLDPKSLAALRSTNRKLHDLSETPYLWTNLHKRDYGGKRLKQS